MKLKIKHHIIGLTREKSLGFHKGMLRRSLKWQTLKILHYQLNLTPNRTVLERSLEILKLWSK